MKKGIAFFLAVLILSYGMFSYYPDFSLSRIINTVGVTATDLVDPMTAISVFGGNVGVDLDSISDSWSQVPTPTGIDTFFTDTCPAIFRAIVNTFKGGANIIFDIAIMPPAYLFNCAVGVYNIFASVIGLPTTGLKITYPERTKALETAPQGFGGGGGHLGGR